MRVAITVISLMVVPTIGAARATEGDSEPKRIIQIDCSAYRKQSDGSWKVLKPNKIWQDHVAREVVPGDKPEAAELTDGTSLRRYLDGLCSHYQQR